MGGGGSMPPPEPPPVPPLPRDPRESEAQYAQRVLDQQRSWLDRQERRNAEHEKQAAQAMRAALRVTAWIVVGVVVGVRVLWGLIPDAADWRYHVRVDCTDGTSYESSGSTHPNLWAEGAYLRIRMPDGALILKASPTTCSSTKRSSWDANKEREINARN